MSDVRAWDKRFRELAACVAGWSKDVSSQVGAVIVGTDRRRISLGYNGFPRGVTDDEERFRNRETRLKLTLHAERNALDNAAFDVSGATLYVTFFTCSECAKSIVQRGIRRVVCPPPCDREPWVSDARWTRLMFEEAGVRLEEVP